MDRGRGFGYRGRGRGRANLGERGGQVRDLVTRLNRQLQLEPPPDDFRELTIIPTFEDIHTDKEPFLRPNIVRGRYPDMDTYLDVQFRLLREDFVRPLREGILDIRRRGLNQKGKLQDIHVYHDVHVVYPTYSNQGMVYRIQFDSSRLKGVKWGPSKRLIYGSLVCLTKDEFETMNFATVLNSNPAELEQGWVDVRFEDATFDVLRISPMDTFIMVESSAFFEAYRHVLKGLQEVQEGTMPFAKYIVDCDCANGVDPPAYLRSRFGNVRYDLSAVVEKVHSRRKQQLTEVPVLRDDLWPSAKDLGFDESQYRAFKLGLTKEFAVIQGPPGTGKTYIGLKIIEVLLKNRSAWRGLNGGRGTTRKATRPILVVCYTNHALDQFLEGIAESYPEGIVRVGGRSKSEKLERFKLTNIRQKVRQDKSVPWHIKKRAVNATREIKCLQEEMDEHLDQLTATQSKLLHENTLMQVNLMDRRQQVSLMQGWQEAGSEKGGSAIVNWLGLGGRALLEVDGQDHDADSGEEEETINFMDDPEEQRRLDDDEVLYGRGNKGKRKRKPANTGLTVDLADLQMKETQAGNLGGWQVKVNEKKRRNLLKRQLSKTEMMTQEEARQVRNVWMLEIRDRWRLYRYWVAKYCELHKEPISAYADRYEEVARRLEDLRNDEDRRIMEKATVIGMTTTGAAKYRSILHAIQPAIIMVEEAAEVLEAHIVTTLSQQCQHLILIGDHQQLRPNPTVYQLAKENHLDISLFERMVNNDMECVRLKLQHRMRPEFARLLTPHIYESLDNHESVLNFKDIKGVSSNLFFLDHSHVEERAKDTKSRSNMHEAQFLASFCRYLLQQGYSPSQITILTTYSGQLLNLKNVMPRKIFAGVRVCTVDNFQGEESDIILLSLVRSNDENIAGFLKVENRVCVALSRAKKGFYAIGNLTMLAKASKLWRKIRQELREQGSIGTSLTLSCQNHPDSEILVSTADDFKKTPNGGCMRPCGTMLQCGHVCGIRCHLTDRKHEKYKCQKPCAKVRCDLGHKCQKRCSQKCGKCEVLVEKTFPCHHKLMVPCHEASEMPSEKVLPCGHRCKNTCSQKCSVPCMEMVAHRLPCGHTIQAACSAKEDDLVCNTPCRHLLECGHRCSGTCGRCKQGRLHQQCTHHCKRVLSSHQSKAKSTSTKTHVQREATAGTLLIELHDVQREATTGKLLIELNDVQREATAGKLLTELNDVNLLIYCVKSASDLRNQVASCRLPSSPNQVAMFEKKTVFLKTLARRKKDKIEHLSVLEDKRHRMELDGEIAKLEAWLIRPTAHVSEQDWEEFGRKVVRLKCLLKLRILQGQIRKKGISLDDQDKVFLDYAEGVLTELKPFTKTREELVRKALKTVHGLTLRSPVLMGAVARSVSGSATRRKEPQASAKQSSGPEDGRSVVRRLVRSYEDKMQFDY